MASKQFWDGVTTDGVKYQLVTASDDTTAITNITNWSQAPTEVQASGLIQGLVLECDHTKTGTVHALTNPNATLNAIRFKATSDYADGDTFTVNGTSITTVNGTPLFCDG